MPQVAAEPEPQTAPPTWRAAIVDDVYAGPTRLAVADRLAQFCAEISAGEGLTEQLSELTQCEFDDPHKVTDEGLARLHQGRDSLAKIGAQLDDLFRSFDQRYKEVTTIEGHLRTHGCTTQTFHSVHGLFDGAPFELVLLDLRLAKGEKEAQEIAKQIYEHSKAFILLMSNIPGAGSPVQAEEFRRKTRLIRGLFDFCAKDKLCDAGWFRTRMSTLPKDPEVCRAVYDFVMAIDKALGGPIDEPEPAESSDSKQDVNDEEVLGRFIHTLRTLGLQDYALLCELTLRDEGHPLGDYMMRLLGSHLIAQLMKDRAVRNAVAQLDRMRFTEFLPFGDASSASFNRMYADSLTEEVITPWTSHPWANPTAVERTADAAPAPTAEVKDAPEGTMVQSRPVAAPSSEILQLCGFRDDGRDLPFLQLGDVLIKDESSLVYCVLSASCDLQFTPESVSTSRPRERDDTVLLLPGKLRRVPPFSKARATTGLIEWNKQWFCIDWIEDKLLGLPHCVVRTLLEDKAYQHQRRLLVARAIELQNTVLSWVSRIGLDVQPPFPMECEIAIFGRQVDDSFVQLGSVLAPAGLVFHGRVQPALVLRDSCFHQLAERMRVHSSSLGETINSNRKVTNGISQAIEIFTSRMIGMKLPIVVPEDSSTKSLRVMDGTNKGSAINQIALRVGKFDEPPIPPQKEAGFCLSIQILSAPRD